MHLCVDQLQPLQLQHTSVVISFGLCRNAVGKSSHKRIRCSVWRFHHSCGRLGTEEHQPEGSHVEAGWGWPAVQAHLDEGKSRRSCGGGDLGHACYVLVISLRSEACIFQQHCQGWLWALHMLLSHHMSYLAADLL